jgi:hypothetical protein
MKCISQILSFFVSSNIDGFNSFNHLLNHRQVDVPQMPSLFPPSRDKGRLISAPRYVPLQEFEEIKATVKQEAGCR